MKKLILFLLAFALTIEAAYTYYYFQPPNGAGGLTAADYANAGSLDTLQHYWADHSGASVCFIIRASGAASTLTAAMNSTAHDGSSAEPFLAYGVKSTCAHTGDALVAADMAANKFDTGISVMPHFIETSTFNIYIGDTSRVYNLHVVGDVTYSLRADNASKYINCFVYHNQQASLNEYAMGLAVTSSAINCMILGDSVVGVTTGNYCRVSDCWFQGFRGSGYSAAVSAEGGSQTIVHNVIYNCRRGIKATADNNHYLYLNTIDLCDTGITVTTDRNWDIIDNTITNCTVGIVATAENGSIFKAYNTFYNNGTDFINISNASPNIDFNLITGAVTYTSPFDGTYQAGSACINTGMK